MRNLFKPTSYRKGAALAVGATALWKGLSFVNALLIAAYFGAGSATDLYFYIILVTGLGTYFLQRMNSAVIIPEAMTLNAHVEGKGRFLLNGFLYFYVMLIVLAVGLGLFFPVGIAHMFSRFTLAQLTAQRTLLVLGILLFGLQLLACYLTAILEMYRRFSVSLFSPLNALLPLLCLLLFGKHHGIVSMMYGFVTANALQIIVFLTVMKKELDWKFSSWILLPSRNFKYSLTSNQLIELVNIVNGLLPLYLLSGLSAGLVSALNYARQLTDSTTEVFSLRVTNVSKIELTEYAAREKYDLFNASYLDTHKLLCFFLAPLTVFSIFYAPQIITVFFKRGLFDGQDVQHAAAFLRPLLGITLLMVPILMQNNAVAARRKLKKFLPYALSSMLLFTLLIPFTMRTYGPVAYLYTQLGCIGIGFAINAIFFKRVLPFLSYGRSLWDMVQLIILNILALLPAALLTSYVLASNNPWIIVGCGGILFLLVWVVLFCWNKDLLWFLSHFKRHSVPLP